LLTTICCAWMGNTSAANRNTATGNNEIIMVQTPLQIAEKGAS
jgi:hypothetical protein